jgi:hypothetical protein
VETVLVTLVADLPGCTTTALEFVSKASGGWVCELFSSFNCCSKAARAAAWAGVSSARTAMKLTPRTTHKPTQTVVFMKCAFEVERKEMTCPGASGKAGVPGQMLKAESIFSLNPPITRIAADRAGAKRLNANS